MLCKKCLHTLVIAHSAICGLQLQSRMAPCAVDSCLHQALLFKGVQYPVCAEHRPTCAEAGCISYTGIRRDGEFFVHCYRHSDQSVPVQATIDGELPSAIVSVGNARAANVDADCFTESCDKPCQPLKLNPSLYRKYCDDCAASMSSLFDIRRGVTALKKLRAQLDNAVEIHESCVDELESLSRMSQEIELVVTSRVGQKRKR